MRKRQNRLNSIVVFAGYLVQLVQIALFCIGTALIYLSNIRRARGRAFTPLKPFQPHLRSSTPLPILPSVNEDTAVPLYCAEELTAVTERLPESEKPKVKLDTAFAGTMKSLGFTKAELQCIVQEITAQDFDGQVRQALKLLNKPTLKVAK